MAQVTMCDLQGLVLKDLAAFSDPPLWEKPDAMS